MNCPECKHEMVEQSLMDRDQRPLHIDVCYGCRGLWFDTHESLKLSPGSTLRLCREMHHHRGEPRPRGKGPRSCPRCDQKLSPAQDWAHRQRFLSSRCLQGHGHFITFFQFLREKGLARELKPQELLELRKHVDTILCSDCGEPLRLANMRACARCQAPVSLLDPEKMGDTVREAGQHAGSRQNVSPEVAARLLMDRLKLKDFHPPSPAASQAIPLVTLSAASPSGESSGWASDLIGHGLEFVVEGIAEFIFDLF